ncbi:putative ABC transport system permease protein [Amycolatopsis bartoniae]|uniref:ABC transporter permease n=1 Tax=Amycolatopsis bartoniae TaxID=941986 RepID=A0A8H9J0I4_9PSEU|nr:FtsX-like permease family protein [Amycolatopsis bartoniae]MBB2935063.1 putative ABC transport system permease protein [Amycolatopsis bartoniae]TVT02542.1 FtsX-like permease family protein [Amycolatopsis bartoniae]GHF74071.1 ABC transporter permease [Amycolatopsis bartoniae]
MFSLAWKTIRARRGSFAAAFVAVFCGSALITASGVLLDSGLRSGIAPERYAAAPVVVAAGQDVSFGQRFAERVPLSVERVADVARVPGVRAAVGDVSVQAGLRGPDGSVPVVVHGASSAQLETGLVDGRMPAAADEVALAGAHVGDTVSLAVGAIASPYRVVGTTGSGAFVTDEQARTLSGRPDRVDAVAVLADPGTDADGLAARIRQAVPGADVLTGNDRADAEFLDVGAARSFLVLIAGSFGGTMLIIVLLVVASTLGLTIQQRRQEFALLRAIAATPKQVSRLVATETLLLSTVAAVLGALPGVGLTFLLRHALAGYGAVPENFQFVLGPLPVVAAVVTSVVAALGAGLIAARRAARVSPVAALGEAKVEPPTLGRARLVLGWSLIPLGVALSVGLPMTVGGDAATGGAAGSVLVLVIAVALLGPRLLTATAGVLGRLGLGFLAEANTRARSRRVGSATTPLIMGVALAAVQIFTLTTTDGAAQRQAEDGLLADRVLVAQGGIAPAVADAVRRTPGVTAAVPVAHTQVLVNYQEMGDPATESYAAQGVTPDGLGSVLNLDLRRGSLDALTDGTVAVSQFAAGTFGVDVGSTLSLQLGDGTPYQARVVGIYGNGLGFGDLTLPHDVVVAHTTSRLDDEILLAGTDFSALNGMLANYPEIQATDALQAAQRDDGQSSVTLLLNLVLLAFIAIAVVNILVLATAARVREFALLRLVGAKPRQVRSMMRGEAAVVVVASVVLGSLVAVPPLVGISLSVTGFALPTVPPLLYLAIVAVAVALGWGSIALPARFALRPAPVAAMRVGE